MSDPRKYFRNNVINTLNLLNVMVQAGVKNIVFSSSCATYGIPQNGLIEESHPQCPLNPYGESNTKTYLTLGNSFPFWFVSHNSCLLKSQKFNTLEIP